MGRARNLRTGTSTLPFKGKTQGSYCQHVQHGLWLPLCIPVSPTIQAYTDLETRHFLATRRTCDRSKNGYAERGWAQF